MKFEIIKLELFQPKLSLFAKASVKILRGDLKSFFVLTHDFRQNIVSTNVFNGTIKKLIAGKLISCQQSCCCDERFKQSKGEKPKGGLSRVFNSKLERFDSAHSENNYELSRLELKLFS
jgi:hypothetical protein